jgi:hypothetical protein
MLAAWRERKVRDIACQRVNSDNSKSGLRIRTNTHPCNYGVETTHDGNDDFTEIRELLPHGG